MRDGLVQAAVRLLAEEGPAAVQARRLAREVGASTMAVYHHFGGMPQLLSAVVEEGFRRLDARLAAVEPTADPVTDLARLAFAYRAAARENPHLYDLMFGLAEPGGHRPDEIQQDTGPAASSYGHLVAAATRTAEAGRIRADDPRHVAAQLWSMLHGYVTLELAGRLGELDGPHEVFLPMARNLLVGLGAAPEGVDRSAARALAGGEP